MTDQPDQPEPDSIDPMDEPPFNGYPYKMAFESYRDEFPPTGFKIVLEIELVGDSTFATVAGTLEQAARDMRPESDRENPFDADSSREPSVTDAMARARTMTTEAYVWRVVPGKINPRV